MRILSLVMCQLVCFFGEAVAADETRFVIPAKLAVLLAATGSDGEPFVIPEQRAYFDGLNDHLKTLLSKVVDAEIVTRGDHLGSILALGLRPQKMEVFLQDNCVLCHTDPEIQKPETLFSLAQPSSSSTAHSLQLRDLVDDVHFGRGLSCAGCHGGDPASDKLEHSFVEEWPSTGRADHGWVPAFCARCHSDPTFMNRFNPALPTDQWAKYRESPHGKLLLESKDLRAPDCVSCHGVHGIRSGKHPLSKVYPKRVPETCGACHANPETMAGFKMPDGTPLPTNQLAEYRTSIHGIALLERGDLGAPACNNCHGNHAAMPVGLSNVSQSCGLCHAGNASLFDGSRHKLAFEEHKWAQCGQCHGHHGIAKADDSLLAPGPGALCTQCHQEFASDKPECTATAAYFYASITGLDQARIRFVATAEELAMKGLDVDPIHNQLNELGDSLKQARSHIHSFSKNDFDRIAAPGVIAVQSISKMVEEARSEYRLRQLGLVGIIVLIGVVMLLLYLKLRQLERQPGEKNLRNR